MAARVVLSYNGEILAETRLTKPVTVVGRHPDCDIVVESAVVSGRHMLFRLVGRTVYAEDLASTNGTLINGLPASHQVVHHLDQIEIGRHKLHFFDDALLAGGLSDLESTVITEYERTMMAGYVSESRPQPAPEAVAQAAQEAPPRPEAPLEAHAGDLEPATPRPARRADDDLSRTMSLPAESGLASTLPGSAHARATSAGPAPFALRVASGAHAQELLSLDHANTMIGEAGVDTALVVRRGSSMYLARLAGHRPLRLNRRTLGPGTHALAEGDVIEVGDAVFEVINAAALAAARETQ